MKIYDCDGDKIFGKKRIYYAEKDSLHAVILQKFLN